MSGPDWKGEIDFRNKSTEYKFNEVFLFLVFRGISEEVTRAILVDLYNAVADEFGGILK